MVSIFFKNIYVVSDKKLYVEIFGLCVIKRLNSLDKLIKINSEGKRF